MAHYGVAEITGALRMCATHEIMCCDDYLHDSDIVP